MDITLTFIFSHLFVFLVGLAIGFSAGIKFAIGSDDESAKP